MKLTCFATIDQSKFNSETTVRQSSQRAATFAMSQEPCLWLQLWCARHQCRAVLSGMTRGAKGWPQRGTAAWLGRQTDRKGVYMRNQQLYGSWFCTPGCCDRLIYFCLVRAMIDTNLTSDRNQIKSLLPYSSWGADNTLKQHIHQEGSSKISLGWGPAQNGAGLPNQIQILCFWV